MIILLVSLLFSLSLGMSLFGSLHSMQFNFINLAFLNFELMTVIWEEIDIQNRWQWSMKMIQKQWNSNDCEKATKWYSNQTTRTLYYFICRQNGQKTRINLQVEPFSCNNVIQLDYVIKLSRLCTRSKNCGKLQHIFSERRVKEQIAVWSTSDISWTQGVARWGFVLCRQKPCNVEEL